MLDPANSAVDRVKLACGDTDKPYWLDDTVYKFSLESNNGNEKAAIRQCAYYILAQLSRNAHEKLVQIEIYGKEYFDNYKEFIQMVIKNPSCGNIAPIPYAGGVMKSEQSVLVSNGDVNIYKTPLNRARNRLSRC